MKIAHFVNNAKAHNAVNTFIVCEAVLYYSSNMHTVTIIYDIYIRIQ